MGNAQCTGCNNKNKSSQIEEYSNYHKSRKRSLRHKKKQHVLEDPTLLMNEDIKSDKQHAESVLYLFSPGSEAQEKGILSAENPSDKLPSQPIALKTRFDTNMLIGSPPNEEQKRGGGAVQAAIHLNSFAEKDPAVVKQGVAVATVESALKQNSPVQEEEQPEQKPSAESVEGVKALVADKVLSVVQASAVINKHSSDVPPNSKEKKPIEMEEQQRTLSADLKRTVAAGVKARVNEASEQLCFKQLEKESVQPDQNASNLHDTTQLTGVNNSREAIDKGETSESEIVAISIPAEEAQLDQPSEEPDEAEQESHALQEALVCIEKPEETRQEEALESALVLIDEQPALVDKEEYTETEVTTSIHQEKIEEAEPSKIDWQDDDEEAHADEEEEDEVERVQEGHDPFDLTHQEVDLSKSEMRKGTDQTFDRTDPNMDAQSEMTTFMKRANGNTTFDGMSSNDSYMVRVNDGQSDNSSFMVKVGPQSNRFDDVSSNGSFMVRLGGVGNKLEDMPSQGGSYMVSGLNDKTLFNADDDDSQMEIYRRGSAASQTKKSFIDSPEKVPADTDEADAFAISLQKGREASQTVAGGNALLKSYQSDAKDEAALGASGLGISGLRQSQKEDVVGSMSSEKKLNSSSLKLRSSYTFKHKKA